MNTKHVACRRMGKLMLYALSTCVWCRKTKKLLDDLGVDYDYLDVDLIKGVGKKAAINSLKKHNPDCSFPTLVINDQRCIIGFKEEEIREALKP